MNQLLRTGQTAATATAAPPAATYLQDFYRNRAKRWADVILALAALPVALPIVLLCAALIALDGGNPFFGHPRVGAGGRLFRCWKLRTMHRDPARILEAHFAAHPHLRREFEIRRKLRSDPRVTRLGRVLRKCSIDELPQLLNVLRGEMSLVGPRPVTEEELARYGAHARLYRTVRPGITGLWQVNGRNSLSLEQRMRFDSAYAARVRASTDLAILLRTGRALLSGQ